MKKRKLNRLGRVVRNLLLALVCGVLVWAGLGAPLFSREGEFQRLQREYLLTELAPIEGLYQETWPSGEQWTAVGVNTSYLVFGNLDRQDLSAWPRQGDGPVLAPAPDSRMTADPTQPAGGWLIAADVPEGTASAVLTAHLSCWYTLAWEGDAANVELSPRSDYPWQNGPPSYWEETYSVPGERISDRIVRFYLHEDESGDRPAVNAVPAAFDWETYLRPAGGDIRSQMTAVFYDQAGEELGWAALESA